MMRAASLLALATAALAVGTASGAPGLRPCRGVPAPRAYDHVLLVILENHASPQVAGASPYLNSVAAACGLANDYSAITHPSLPNDLALTSGGTDGISSDCTDCSAAVRSIFEQVGGRWRSYLESIPAVGFTAASSGKYVKRHNPASYYTRITAAYRTRAVPLSRLRTDLAAATLPRFALVVPNLCDDEHDCDVAAGDRWLSVWLPRILGSSTYKQGRTALFVTYDEGSDSDNHVYTVVASPSVRRGTVSETPFDHYALLATMERLLRLPCLADACTAPVMSGAFHLLAP
jgi:phospholipase C